MQQDCGYGSAEFSLDDLHFICHFGDPGNYGLVLCDGQECQIRAGQSCVGILADVSKDRKERSAFFNCCRGGTAVGRDRIPALSAQGCFRPDRPVHSGLYRYAGTASYYGDILEILSWYPY